MWAQELGCTCSWGFPVSLTEANLCEYLRLLKTPELIPRMLWLPHQQSKQNSMFIGGYYVLLKSHLYKKCVAWFTKKKYMQTLGVGLQSVVAFSSCIILFFLPETWSQQTRSVCCLFACLRLGLAVSWLDYLLVTQAGLKLGTSASASSVQVLGLQACITMLGIIGFYVSRKDRSFYV